MRIELNSDNTFLSFDTFSIRRKVVYENWISKLDNILPV